MSKPTELQGREEDYINKADLNHKTNEIIDFCQANNITSQELFTAYQIALGIAQDPAARAEVSQLATLLDANFKNGYPLNRIAELVDAMATTETQQINRGRSLRNKKREIPDVEYKGYMQMSDAEIKAALRHICAESSTEDEVKQKIKDQLKYPYEVAITSHTPTDQIGREAQQLVRDLGGPIMKNGAMVMVMIHGPRGTISI